MSTQHEYTSRIGWTVPRGAGLAVADAIHHQNHEVCFIARSVSFPVSYQASYVER